jgi:lactoylglutathione lyase
MAKLRHLAIVVKDMEASARFYEKVFEMKRAFVVKDRAIYLTDGLMNLAVLAYANTNRPGAQTADGRHGIHHFGFRIADFKETEAALEAAGATYAFDLGDSTGLNYERKWRDPEGILFDVSEKGWYGALDEAAAEKAQEKEPVLS